MLAHLADGFSTALSLHYLLISLLGVALGTAIGVLPGLGPAATIALLLPITFAAGDAVGAFVMFGGIIYGAMYGGSTTSILINTPGETSSVVTTLDGYQMAKRGRAGAALAAAAIGSFVAGTFATFAIMALAQPLTSVALKFGAAEYFAVMLLALAIVVTLGGHPAKALFSLSLGLALGTIGIDFQTGQARFAFGVLHLYEGIDIVACAMGLFAISEVLFGLGQLRKARASGEKSRFPIGSLFMTKGDWKASAGPWLRGSFIGFIAGTLPGVGASIASFLSYGLEKMIGRKSNTFGRGDIRGVAGPEAANNAAMGGHLVPLLILGIPGSATTAVMLAAFQGYGIHTGPLLLQENSHLVWTLIASLYIGNAMLLVLNLPLVGIWVKLLQVPAELLYVCIVAISVLGAYSLNNAMFNVYVMLAFGLLGLLLRRASFPLAPVILGLILGPLIEVQFRQALTLSSGDWSIFVSTPLAVGLLIAALLLGLSPLIVRALSRNSSAVVLSNDDTTVDSH